MGCTLSKGKLTLSYDDIQMVFDANNETVHVEKLKQNQHLYNKTDRAIIQKLTSKQAQTEAKKTAQDN